MHLTIDGFGGDRQRLASAEVVQELLAGYRAALRLCTTAPANVQREAGAEVCGFMAGARGHISVYTSSARGQVWIDIFSVDDFDTTRMILHAAAVLGLREVTTRLVERAAAGDAG
jgi:hypothetical protein